MTFSLSSYLLVYPALLLTSSYPVSIQCGSSIFELAYFDYSFLVLNHNLISLYLAYIIGLVTSKSKTHWFSFTPCHLILELYPVSHQSSESPVTSPFFHPAHQFLNCFLKISTTDHIFFCSNLISLPPAVLLTLLKSCSLIFIIKPTTFSSLILIIHFLSQPNFLHPLFPPKQICSSKIAISHCLLKNPHPPGAQKFLKIILIMGFLNWGIIFSLRTFVRSPVSNLLSQSQHVLYASCGKRGFLKLQRQKLNTIALADLKTGFGESSSRSCMCLRDPPTNSAKPRFSFELPHFRVVEPVDAEWCLVDACSHSSNGLNMSYDHFKTKHKSLSMNHIIFIMIFHSLLEFKYNFKIKLDEQKIYKIFLAFKTNFILSYPLSFTMIGGSQLDPQLRELLPIRDSRDALINQAAKSGLNKSTGLMPPNKKEAGLSNIMRPQILNAERNGGRQVSINLRTASPRHETTGWNDALKLGSAGSTGSRYLSPGGDQLDRVDHQNISCRVFLYASSFFFINLLVAVHIIIIIINSLDYIPEYIIPVASTASTAQVSTSNLLPRHSACGSKFSSGDRAIYKSPSPRFLGNRNSHPPRMLQNPRAPLTLFIFCFCFLNQFCVCYHFSCWHFHIPLLILKKVLDFPAGYPASSFLWSFQVSLFTPTEVSNSSIHSPLESSGECKIACSLPELTFCSHPNCNHRNNSHYILHRNFFFLSRFWIHCKRPFESLTTSVFQTNYH
ncbi:putative signal peptide protein [Puccinia sorghi]|uniref:Putative signal peptide protein n=1 Tax=Puccinia sorghi TaxID=27349 RepID=A0A0L6UAJ3_9BASI|nr:putative signal peptide protein [Puccinia sorghi]